MKRNTKAVAMILSAGTLFHSIGCLGLGSLGALWPWVSQAAFHAAFEYVLDNDGVFDLVEDGNVAAAE